MSTLDECPTCCEAAELWSVTPLNGLSDNKFPVPTSEEKLEFTLELVESGEVKGGECTEGTTRTMAASMTATEEGSSLTEALSLRLK